MAIRRSKITTTNPDVFVWLPEQSSTSETTTVEPKLKLGITVRGDLGGGTLYLDTRDGGGNWWPQPVTIGKSPSYTHYADLRSTTYRLRLIHANSPAPLITVAHNDPGKTTRKTASTKSSNADAAASKRNRTSRTGKHV